jgi:outer membrane protein OmpA-like peptidoglycan-associated protein/tetratricopeptide (TPR) repeat protein
MRKLLFIFSCIWVVAGFAQEQMTALDMELEKAHTAFNQRKYNTAANLFAKIHPKIKDEQKRDQVLYMVAESYRQSNNFRKAFEFYDKLVNTKYPDPKILYSYGLLLKNFERYEEASRQFFDYLFEVPDDADAKREQQSCAVAIEWKARPEKFTVNNVAELNTPYSDYAPFYQYNRLVWASSRNEAFGKEIFEWTGQKCSDYFESKYSNGKWGPVQKVKGSVNTNFNDGTAWIDTGYTTMYLTQCNGADGKGVGCKLYVSYFRDTGWSVPESLPFNSEFYSNGHPALAPDGKRLYFASDMPGGFGLKDLYYADYNPVTNTWGKPVNLGPNVNTADDDMFPTVDEDGNVYFSSKGWLGMGGLDIFITRNVAGAYTQARNLKYPINSGGDDFNLSYIPKSLRQPGQPVAYFSSNREGGKGDDDIYSLSIKPYFFVVKGKVVDAISEAPIVGAQVKVADPQGVLLNMRTGNDGMFIGEMPLKKLAELVAEKDKYFNSNPVQLSSMNVVNDTTVELVIQMQTVPDSETEIVLEGIFYDLDKADLRKESKIILDSIAVILKTNPNISIELSSHTDSRAPDDYNMKLSQRRAQSCVDYLLEKGIEKGRMLAKGYGETKLMNECADGVDCTEEQHQENRRTSIRILSTDYKSKRK